MKSLSNEIIDAGKRASDIVNTYILGMDFDEIKTKFIAIRLSDGGSDGVLYDSKPDAARHQAHEQQCAYVCLRHLIAGSSPRDMAIFLNMNREAYAAGLRFVDHDAINSGPDLAPTTASYEFQSSMLAQVTQKDIEQFRKELGLS